MPSASSRARTMRYKTEPLDLQAIPRPQREEDGAVAKLRIVNVGTKAAARSGTTWQLPGPVQPGQPMPEPPRVIRARTIHSAPLPQEQNFDAMYDERPVFNVAPGYVQRVADLQVRAARALSGLSANLPTQRIEACKTWSKPSTRVMSVAVGVYTLALFLFALLGR